MPGAAARKFGLIAERSDVDCPFSFERAAERRIDEEKYNPRLFVERYARAVASADHRAIVKRAETCAESRLVRSEKSIPRAYAQRGEISGNWPYKVHGLVTVIPFYPPARLSVRPSVRSAALARARAMHSFTHSFSLSLSLSLSLSAFKFLFFHGRDEISGGGRSRPSSPRGGLAQYISIEPGFERFACHDGSGGSECLRQEGEAEKGGTRSSSRIYRKHRHLPPPPAACPSPRASLSARAYWCLRKNTEYARSIGGTGGGGETPGNRSFARFCEERGRGISTLKSETIEPARLDGAEFPQRKLRTRIGSARSLARASDCLLTSHRRLETRARAPPLRRRM